MRILHAAVAMLAMSLTGMAQTTLFPRGSMWKYLEAPAPTNWTGVDFDDSTWSAGRAKLGYGESDESTRLEPNGNPVYFRQAFMVASPSELRSLTLRIVVDDGAVIHFNGTEVARYNLPAGPINTFTQPLENIETNENRPHQYGIRTNLLRAGINVLAVQLHQHLGGPEDASFDAELLANLPDATPEVSIVSPADGAVFHNAPVVMEVDASDSTGHIQQVDVFANGSRIARLQSEPFVLQWTPPSPGRYTLFARARNYRSESGESPPITISYGAPGFAQLKHEPYLQSCTTTSIVIRWNTSWFTNAVVRYGPDPAQLNLSQTNHTQSTAHELKLSGLTPGTRYHYSVGTTDQALTSGPNYYFKTSPTNAGQTRIWVVGDSGSRDANAIAVRDAYYDSEGDSGADVMLMLGDNSYGNGTVDDYQIDVFQMYGALLKNTPAWLTLGNHDVGDSRKPFMSAYLASFTMPTQGEAGGTPSGTELYYSFDHANIHFICLDSYVSSRQPGSAMLRWLEDDLSATTKDWIIAFWHHPPYSKGSHDSDNDPWQTEMRQFVLPVLEAYGVDLVLCGHSHSYERSFLIDGHYGFSTTLQPEMILDRRPGHPAATGPYRKPAGGLGANRGAVYAVCGCSGQGGSGPFSTVHPVMATSLGGWGSMAIEVDGLKLTAKFVRPSRAIDDLFVIDKSMPSTITPRIAIRRESEAPLLSWPTATPQFDLEQSFAVGTHDWLPFPGNSWTHGRRRYARPDTNAPQQFFRLRSESAR